jgi:beta-1,4-mannosyl-glycoprotein beta-1,4-N-acetylglucosaminyltransferase
MKIIDCFIFYNELDLLTYRLNLLYNVVDYFIIVESTHTFVGKTKQLFFNENKQLFEKFSNKIIHIIVNDFPYKHGIFNISNENVWCNEYFQRNAISRGINYVDHLSHDDVIIITDVDEIPDPRTLDKIKQGDITVNVNTLEMDFYYYNLNTKHQTKWTLGKIISYKKYNELNISCNDIRNKQCSHILNGGWHLSYFGDSLFIQNKIQNFSHQELNNANYADLDKIENRVKNSKDLYDRSSCDINKIKIEDNSYLPIDYDKYLNNYYKKADISYKYSQRWFLNSEIKHKLHKFLDKTNENKILEIGCFEGLSSVFFADNFIDNPNSRLTCVDPFLTIDDNDHHKYLMNHEELNFDFNISNCKNVDKISVHKITSDCFFKNNKETYNFIYIDGSHETDLIKKDMENSFKCLEKNGIMWMNDYGGGESNRIKKVMDKILDKYSGQYILIHKGYQIAIKKY